LAYVKLHTTQGERQNAGRLPAGRREQLSWKYFGNENQKVIWKRPFFVMVSVGSNYYAHISLRASLHQGRRGSRNKGYMR
jgi:hypothetical protein